MRRERRPAARRLRALALFVAGVLVYADASAVAITALIAVILLLLAIGFSERRARAVLWALVLVAGAFVGDVLWQLGWEPYDRSSDYEPLAQTPFVVIGLPIPMGVIAVGAAAGALLHRRRASA